ncbi:glycosyltransferase family 2 protein [Stutzerimonas zhaodongensis]|uniref:Glycosyltransferase family 2 protein n=1 Tax=Stutzerimonas zhaodongensis TaxID=1176257 RepID=A0A3M2HXL0_9GAMM|nr:glycosyltransferase family 2 protein [Stutzerimonas zhaodongensis]MCQ4315484.1 glycosyltransferase family 2 protein [Stutzerimonas zhaodongensis]RMH91642.1 glycosyltransferase family 2 protein [Stutzerimonas zhaodongensis]
MQHNLRLAECRISVIVPCYNYAEFVGDALRSVLSQDHPSFELIVVDDGSTDDSAAVIQRVIDNARDSSKALRTVFVRQANQGVSAALNAGLAVAQGEFIASFDADDVMVAGRLRLQADYLAAHPEVGCVGGIAQRIDDQGALLPKKAKNRQVKRYDFAQVLANCIVVGGNLAMYRREAIDRVGGYDSSIKVQDFQITHKIAYAGYFIDVLPDIVTLYRKHAGGLSRNYEAEYRYSMQVIEAYKDHPSFESGKARLLIKILGPAAILNKRLAWSLLTQVPVRQWNRQYFKRVRHFFFKWQRAKSRHDVSC